MERAEAAKGVTWFGRMKVARKKHKRKRQRRRGARRGQRRKKNRSEIAQEVVASIKEVASAQEDAKSIAQRTVGQRFTQIWDCSQIENEEEEEEEGWQKGDQM